MTDSSQNPYATPPRAAAADVQTYQGFSGRGLPSTVQQVMVVSILQIVVGALELLVSAILAVYTGILGAMSTGAIEMPEGEEEALFVFGIISAVMLFFGSAIFIAAVLRIWSGIAGFKFKRRKMAIFASVLGMTSALTMYCSVFSIGMLIYGLIIYLDRNVKRAYEMAEQGMTPDQIRDPRNW